jgi:hypothetical protein
MEEKINIIHRFIILAISLSLVVLAGCAPVGLPLPPTLIGPTVTPNIDASPSPTPFGPSENTATSVPTARSATTTPTLTPAPILTAGPTEVFVPATYTLSVMLDYVGHLVMVDETISYSNSTGEILNSLVLAVEPNLWKGCFVPGSMTVNGEAVSGSALNGNRLDVPLAVPLMPETSLDFFIHYDLHLPAADVYHVFGYNDQQTNLVDWYPFIVPYVSGQGWLIHTPANVGEHLVYDDQIFDMTMHLTDASVPVVLAASGPAQRISYGWHYRISNVRSFAISASTDYQTASTRVDGLTVTSYFFDSESAQGKTLLTEVAKALRTFDALFGQDPYPRLSIVESPFYDGMEYDGLFFLSRDYYTAENGTVLNNLIDIGVHETAHQWWYGSVGNDQATEPWLDEALATYSERLFYEQNYPDVGAWQAFRIDAYNPTGWVDTDIYHGVDFRTYANAVYLRGAEFLQALREQIGDEAFFAFLKDYAAQLAGRRATSADFFRILRLHTSSDLKDLISSYFQNPY